MSSSSETSIETTIETAMKYISSQMDQLNDNNIKQISKFKYIYNIFKYLSVDKSIITTNLRFKNVIIKKANHFLKSTNEFQSYIPKIDSMSTDQLFFFTESIKIINFFLNNYNIYLDYETIFKLNTIENINIPCNLIDNNNLSIVLQNIDHIIKNT
jgi:sulfur relay (sulfurtransferase) DsrF/TusC family protein